MNAPASSESSRPNFPQMEEEIAAFWEKKRIFERSLEERPEHKTFVFYDGPPFATGLPHYGSLLQSVLKDAVPRYRTMQGYHVPRRWGWDCHGLPIENLIEKELKLGSKREIEAYGIDKFNEACRASVGRYEKEWDRYVKRLGRWVDFENSYKTMDDDFIESVWWVFSELHRKELIYKDRRVSLYCPRCATPLSNFEIAMGDSYEDREDPAVTVKFKVRGEEKMFLLAWTTTPWTLPANVALAVHPDLEYVKLRFSGEDEIYIVAEARAKALAELHGLVVEEGKSPFEILGKMKGAELAGLEYEPLYSFIPVAENSAYRVVAMEYVSADDGTGIVHTAPAFGEEDHQAAKVHNLPVLMTVDDEGRQLKEIAAASSLPIKESDPLIAADLQKRGLLFHEAKITHSVPVCWRCNTLLVYKAQPAWYVNVTKLKPRMLETAKKITWHPAHFKEGRFGQGLETAPDWCISRTRYWGAPLPVWECNSCERRTIVSSVDELRSAAISATFSKNIDLHRPGIDAVKLKCECGDEMKRVPEVFDCWFESGSMPYASAHYPMENRDAFEKNFPGDFIGEAQDQTRGWFYSLHVLSTALFDRPAFKDVIATGLVMAEDGKKMSKKLKNFTDPWELMLRVGADSLRYYLLSSPVLRAEQLNFSEVDCEKIQRTLLGTLWNVRAFYLTYAGSDAVELVKPRSSHVLDRWIFARLMQLEASMTEAMERYDVVEAARLLCPFVDDLSTWWLRRSRERMKGDDAYDRTDALRTLREILLETSCLMAPFTPFFSERLYQDLGGAKMSVHLDRWPKADERLIDEGLLTDMALVRDFVTKGLELRATHKIPVRQALASFAIRFVESDETRRFQTRKEYLELIREELNVERVTVEFVEAAKLTNGQTFEAILDIEITPELRKKGMVRELVRHLMNLRKEAKLSPADRINATIVASDVDFSTFVEEVRETIMKEVKADAIVFSAVSPDESIHAEVKIGEAEVTLAIVKA